MNIDTSRLPPAARIKLQRLADQAADRRGALAAIHDRSRSAGNAHGMAEQELHRLRTYEGSRDQSRIDAARSAVTAAKERLDEVLHQEEPRRVALDSVQLLIQNLRAWIGRLPPSAIAEGPEVKAPSADPVKALDKARERIATGKASLATVRSASLIAPEAKTLAAQALDQLAAEGTPDISALFRGEARIAWPTGTIGRSFGGGTVNGPNLLAILAWIGRDAVLDAIGEAIDAKADDASALGAEARAAKEAELRAALLADERAEEALIEQLESRGLSIERRPDADPRAVLGLADAAHPQEVL